jgi:hypothetical protein
VRPEVAAFRELDTLVRNLTDQLAGYRRRALAAEARQRELERRVDEAEAAVRDALARERSAQDLLRAPITDVFPGISVSGSSAVAASGTASSAPTDDRMNDVIEEAGHDNGGRPQLQLVGRSAVVGDGSDVERENEQLRARLGEARERTALLMERVRFLRQQMAAGAER